MDAKKNLNQNDIIYMLMTDRFNIDSEAKLTEGREECCKPGECLTLYNGGNWEGITKKLDYLKKLGVTAIWISPVSKNVPMFMKEAAFAEASCSGYMTQDYSEPNEHFGTWDNLKRLSEEIHNRGMKLILDVVPNHTADYFISGEKKWKNENRKPAAPFDNIEWYHHKGNVGNWDDEKQVKEGDLGFLADLDQENKDVKEALFNVHHLLVEKANADGLRVDAAKCMQPDFVGEFEKEMDIPTFGEVFDGNVDKIAEYKKRQWGVLDFPLYFAISDVFVDNQNFTRISNVLAEDYKYKNANTMVTFLDNHDRNRFLSVAKDNFEKLRLALAFLFTCRGVPTIYYGTEQNMYGSDRSTDDCGITSKYNREMMKSFAEDNGTYKFIQRLCKIRKSNKCLTEGKQKELICFEDVYAFSRSLEKEKEIITVINKGENPFSIVVPFENNDIGEVLVDLLTGKEINCEAMKEEDKTYYNVRVDSCSVMILSLRKKGEIDSFDIVKNTTQFEFIHKLEKGNTIWIRGDIYPLFSQNGCQMRYIGNNRWQCEIERIKPNTEFNYKYVIKDSEGREISWSKTFKGFGGTKCLNSVWEEDANELTTKGECVTRIVVNMNAGCNNSLLLRGTKGKLFTKSAVPMKKVDENKWECEINDIPKDEKFNFRIVLVIDGEEEWLQEEYASEGGKQSVIEPWYYAKAYIFKKHGYSLLPGTAWKVLGKRSDQKCEGYPVVVK